jgi:hypothetical protein
MCLNDTYSRVQVNKHLSDMFPIKNGLKQSDALLLLLFNFAVECAIKRVHVNQNGLKLNDKKFFFMLLMIICWVETYIL